MTADNDVDAEQAAFGLSNTPQPPGSRPLRLVASSAAPGLPEPSSSLPQPAPSPALRRLQRELAASLAEARSLRELLDELPAILERKFQQRLFALLSEQRQLEQDNAWLQEQLVSVLYGGSQAALAPSTLPVAVADGIGPPANPLLGPAPQNDSPITHGLGLRRALRRLHR